MRERFEQLLNEFCGRLDRSRKADDPPVARFRALLDQFVEAHLRAAAAENAQAAEDRNRFGALLDGYEQAFSQYHSRQAAVADDFNLLEVMNLTGNEKRHSMALAWLLDHDMRRLGTHAQGKLGFRLFLDEFCYLGLPADYANCNYWVRREVGGDDSIVDIEVACRGRFVIHIENKIWSSEGTDQTSREWADLQRRAVDLNVAASEIHALFLTPQGTEPTNRGFHPIRWGRVARVLEAFAEQAKPPEVKLFAGHYARALRRFIVIQDNSEVGNGETTLE